MDQKEPIESTSYMEEIELKGVTDIGTNETVFLVNPNNRSLEDTLWPCGCGHTLFWPIERRNGRLEAYHPLDLPQVVSNHYRKTHNKPHNMDSCPVTSDQG